MATDNLVAISLINRPLILNYFSMATKDIYSHATAISSVTEALCAASALSQMNNIREVRLGHYTGN